MSGSDTLRFKDFLTPNKRPYTLGDGEDANLVGMRLYGGGPFHRELKAANNILKKSHFVIRSGDIIYNKLFAWKGTFGIVPDSLDGMFVSDKFPTYTLDRSQVEPAFLQWYFQYPPLWEQARKMSTGSAALSKLTLNPPRFLDLTLPRFPLREQVRIAEKIDRLAGRIQEVMELRRLSDATHDALYASVIYQAFDEDQSDRQSIEHAIGQPQLKNGKSVKSEPSSDGIKCLRLSGFRDGVIDLSDSKPVPLTRDEAERYLIKKNDVFVMRGNGSKNLVGQAAIATCSDGLTIFPDLLIRIPLDGSGWIPEFFVAIWNSPIMRRIIEDVAKTTSGIWKINQGHIAAMELPLPTKDTQDRILSELKKARESLASTKALVSKQYAAFNALLPSVLDRAFRGEL